MKEQVIDLLDRISAFIGSQGLYLVMGIAGLWFVSRFATGSRGRLGALAASFRRERKMPVLGVGRDAIKTLLEDWRAFAAAEPRLRGMILAGPYAVGTAQPRSEIHLITFTDDLAPYQGKDWLLRCAYLARGHAVRTHEMTPGANAITHRIQLVGAPPLVVHFMKKNADRSIDLSLLRLPLKQGAIVIEDAAGFAAKTLRAWRGQPAQKTGEPG